MAFRIYSSSKQGYMFTSLDIIFIDIKLQEIVVNVVKLDKPEYNSELAPCSCGNIVPIPIRYTDNHNKFKLLVETSGSFRLDKVYRFTNSTSGFDSFIKDLISDIICKYPLVVTSGLLIIFNLLSNDGRGISNSRQCQGCT